MHRKLRPLFEEWLEDFFAYADANPPVEGKHLDREIEENPVLFFDWLYNEYLTDLEQFDTELSADDKEYHEINYDLERNTTCIDHVEFITPPLGSLFPYKVSLQRCPSCNPSNFQISLQLTVSYVAEEHADGTSESQS